MRPTCLPKNACHGHGRGQIRLARARRPDAEGDRVAADGVDVQLLVDGARAHLAAAMRPHHVAVDLGGLARRVDGDVHERLHHRRVQRSPAVDDGEQLVDRGARLVHVAGLALEDQYVTAQRERAIEALLEDLEVRVVLARERQRLAVAVQVDDRARHRRHLQPPRRPRTRSLSFLPSARPATLGLSQPITLPMSLGVDGAGGGDALVDQRLELGVAELLRHVALEEPLLVALLVGEVRAAGPVVELDRLGAPLALALEHRELVGLGGLLAAVDALLLERRDERVAGLAASLVARLERRGGVVLDALFDSAELSHDASSSGVHERDRHRSTAGVLERCAGSPLHASQRVPPMTCQCRCMTSWPASGPVFVMTL